MSLTTELPKDTHITIDETGKYRWRGTINPSENPTIALLIAKVMGLIIGISTVIFLAIGFQCRLDGPGWLMYIGVVGGVMLIVAGIAIIATLLYLRALGESYSADYAMDETGIVFCPGPREQEINRHVAAGTAAMSAFAGKPGVAAASIATMNSDAANAFKSVRCVKGIRKHNVIKVSQLFLYNQVYVAPQDYDFVYHFIATRCPKARCYEA